MAKSAAKKNSEAPREKTARAAKSTAKPLIEKNKTKKEKDLNAPKKPQTAYFLWMNSSREDLKAKNPGLTVGELAKVAGKLWKEVDEKEKKLWAAKADIAKEEYKEKMEKYKSEGDQTKGLKSKKMSDKGNKKKKATESSEDENEMNAQTLTPDSDFQ